MDPGDVLAPAGHRPAGAKAEGGKHLRERAALAVEHDTGAHLHDAHSQVGGGVRLGLPFRAHLCEEARARGGLLIQRLLAVRPVVAHRGGPDEDARTRILR